MEICRVAELGFISWKAEKQAKLRALAEEARKQAAEADAALAKLNTPVAPPAAAAAAPASAPVALPDDLKQDVRAVAADFKKVIILSLHHAVPGQICVLNAYICIGCS